MTAERVYEADFEEFCAKVRLARVSYGYDSTTRGAVMVKVT